MQRQETLRRIVLVYNVCTVCVSNKKEDEVVGDGDGSQEEEEVEEKKAERCLDCM